MYILLLDKFDRLINLLLRSLHSKQNDDKLIKKVIHEFSSSYGLKSSQ